MIEASAVMASAMQATDTENTEPLKVTFFPALYLQRRIWVLNVLRREDVVSVSLFVGGSATVPKRTDEPR